MDRADRRSLLGFKFPISKVQLPRNQIAAKHSFEKPESKNVLFLFSEQNQPTKRCLDYYYFNYYYFMLCHHKNEYCVSSYKLCSKFEWSLADIRVPLMFAAHHYGRRDGKEKSTNKDRIVDFYGKINE
mmetsp:Transcript_18814/g.33953  ORF Transcript_18814/g.33953 Transcript_18814/m.33953 type:complete len:128 (-) Transcript_18814:5-388(-)